MNSNDNNIIRFVPRPLEFVALEQLVRHGRYANPLHLSFWLGGDDETSDDGECRTVGWSVTPLPDNLWEVTTTTRTSTRGAEPEETTERSGALDLGALRSYLETTPFAISDDLFEVLKTRAE